MPDDNTNHGAFFVSNDDLDILGTSPEWFRQNGFPFMNFHYTPSDADAKIEGIVMDFPTLCDWRAIFNDPSHALSDVISGMRHFKIDLGDAEPPTISTEMETARFEDEIITTASQAIRGDLGYTPKCSYFYNPTVISTNHARSMVSADAMCFMINMSLEDAGETMDSETRVIDGDGMTDGPERMYSFTIPNGNKMITPSNNPLISDTITSPEGTVIAQVSKELNMVFILTPMALPIHIHSNKVRSHLFAAIVAAALDGIDDYDPDTVPREEFAKIAGSLLKTEIETARADARRAETDAKEYQRNLAAAIRRKTECEMRANLLEEGKQNDDRIDQQMNMIRNLNVVERFRFRKDNRIVVYTKRIIWKDPDPRHENADGVEYRDFGVARIEIDPFSTDPEEAVRWYNQSIPRADRPGEHNFPHVTSSGGACLGTWSDMFAQVLGRFEPALLIQLAVKFASKANLDDQYGRLARQFPEYTGDPDNPENDLVGTEPDLITQDTDALSSLIAESAVPEPTPIDAADEDVAVNEASDEGATV